jgi:antirestriction protein ArdC
MKNETTKRDVAAEVTAKIVEALEAGTAPWVKPWRDGVGPTTGLELPSNASTGRTYRGVNVVMLWASALTKGYADTRWVTFNQARDLGGSVRKGEKATSIVFWKWLVKDEGTPNEKRIPMARTFSLFNVEQCDGLELDARTPAPTHVDGEADRVAARVGAKVVRGGDRAFFSPSSDTIGMPVADAFATREEYESTLLHELVHWTGHESRNARAFGKRFGDDAYATEELVAELGAAFACARLGVVGRIQHAEYLASWIKVLKADKHAIFTVAREAEKAVDLLLATEEEAEEAEAA